MPFGRKYDRAGKRCHQRVVVSAAEDEVHGFDPERRAYRTQRLSDLEAGGLDVDADPARLRNVTDVAEQPVGEVDHRRGAQGRGLGACFVGRLGAAVCFDEYARGAETAGEYLS